LPAVARALRLTHRNSFTITPTAPFHFDGTFHKPSHFPAPLDAWEPGRYWQALRISDKIFGIKIENRGTRSRPALRVTVFHKGQIARRELEAVRRELLWRFDLDADLAHFDRQMRSDRHLRAVFRRWRGTRDGIGTSLYDLLMISVMLQNATVRRTVQMMTAMLERFGTRVEFDGRELFAIWRPEDLADVDEDELRELKIGYRARFVKRLSDEFANGLVDEMKLRTMDRGTAKRELMKLYGVGPETANIMLYPACRYYGPLDHIAPWQQKIYSRLFYGRRLVPVKRICDDLNRRYGDSAMLAVHYAWEDLFWRRKRKRIDWLEREIRL
jgi:DNA-3-methyladenine glycosylase II